MTGRRLALFRLLIAGFSLVVGLGVLEVFLRMRPVHDRHLDSAIETPQLSAPGEPEFRFPMSSYKKPEGTFRILAVGDSYTFGDGVYREDAYPQRLVARLGQRYPARKIEAVTWARRGWNTAQELQSVRPHLEELDPDLLLLGFTLNDTERHDIGSRNEAREKILPRSPESRLGRWLQNHSVLFDSLGSSLENIRLRRELRIYYRNLFRDGPGVATCRKALKGFHRFTRNRDIPMLVVIFPIFDSQLDNRYRYADSHAAIAKRLAGLNIPAIDLLPAYRGFDGRRLAVTPFTDPHPNELGHRIAADVIARHLVRKGLIPDKPNPEKSIPGAPTHDDPILDASQQPTDGT